MEPKKTVWVLRWYDNGKPDNDVYYPYFQGGRSGCEGPVQDSLKASKKAAHEFYTKEAARDALDASGCAYGSMGSWAFGWKILRRTKRAS